jgi:hypothetical protein
MIQLFEGQNCDSKEKGSRFPIRRDFRFAPANVANPEECGVLIVRCSDEGCGATQILDVLRSYQKNINKME